MPTTGESVGLRYTVHNGGGQEPSRPPLVLIHGAAGHHLFWPPQIRRLDGWVVYALDLPGHGECSSPPESTIGGYAARVLDWMRVVEIDSAILVGHSMGAAIALTAALRSDSIVGLILLGAGSALPVAPEFLQLSETLQTFPEAVDKMVRGSFHKATDRRYVELARQRLHEADPTAFHLDFAACSRFDVGRQLKQITCPALVICGEEDRMTRPEQNRALADGLPEAELFVVPQAGHMVMLEKPEIVAEKMGQFLAERIAANSGAPRAS
jgi:pimeloyl-ACP methyl ester carboxylesterase